MSCLSSLSVQTVFVYLCICVFVFVYLHVRHLGTLFLRSSYNYIFKNIAHVRSICYFDRSCICVFVFVYLHVRHLGTLFLRSLYHYLSENIWFVWSKTSYSGDKRRCYQAGQTNERRQQWKIGLLSLWAVERLSFAI